jgi:putative FmdB family regulatory protein
MPIFEYQCKECMAVSEFLIGVGNEEPITCKKCGSLEMEKVLSTPFLLESLKHRAPGRTCCGQEERCERPPCLSAGNCRRN